MTRTSSTPVTPVVTPQTTTTTSTTTTAPTSCTVGSKQYGTFSPATGSVVAEGATVALTCELYAHTPTTAVLTAICSNGVLSPTSPCLPCPDSTWVFDTTTDRCFKAFPSQPPGAVCDVTVACNGIGAPYGLTGTIVYTPNVPLLVRAAFIAFRANPLPYPQPFWFIGIDDVTSVGVYKLADGTPISQSVLSPLLVPSRLGGLNDVNLRYMNVRTDTLGNFGLDIDACMNNMKAICQLQL